MISCNENHSSNSEKTSSVDEKEYFTIPENTIINLYDAFGKENPDLEKDFGFSCILKYNGKTILFDAGSNADIFKKNVDALNIDLTEIDFVIASHSHFDHINGFDHLLDVHPNVKIYFPFDLFWGANIPFNLSGMEKGVVDSLDQTMQYFDGDYESYMFNQSGRFWNANIEFVKENTEIEPGIKLIATSSPYMGYFTKYPNLNIDASLTSSEGAKSGGANFMELEELSLSLDTDNGEVLIVGCSHSMVERIAIEAKEFTNNDIDMILGGYHLLPYERQDLINLASRLKNELNVQKVAPAHCTGHLAFNILQSEFGDQYVYAGLGEMINF